MNETQQLKIYVAGAWSEKEKLKELMNKLSEKFTITSNWPTRETEEDFHSRMSIHAKEDFKEIDDADMVLAIMDLKKYAYRGTFTEIGYAYGKGKKISIVCSGSLVETGNPPVKSYTHYVMSNVFFWLEGIKHFKTIEEALNFN